MTNVNVENLEMIYNRLYELSVQVGQLIDRKLYSELVTYMAKKEKLLKEAEIIVEKIKDTNFVTAKLTEICTKYQQQELANMKALKSIKEEIKKELTKTSKDSKLIQAYSTNKELKQGNLLDYRQ